MIVGDFSFLPQWVNEIGSIASIISLGISIYVVYAIRGIKRNYQQLETIPKLRNSIEGHLLVLRNVSRKTKNFVELRLEAATIKATATHLIDIVDGLAVESAKKILGMANDLSLMDDPVNASDFDLAKVNQLFSELTYLNALYGSFWRIKSGTEQHIRCR